MTTSSTEPIQPSKKKRPYVFTEKRKAALQKARAKHNEKARERKLALLSAAVESNTYSSTQPNSISSDDEYEYVRVPKKRKKDIIKKKKKKKKIVYVQSSSEEDSDIEETPSSTTTYNVTEQQPEETKEQQKAVNQETDTQQSSQVQIEENKNVLTHQKKQVGALNQTNRQRSDPYQSSSRPFPVIRSKNKFAQMYEQKKKRSYLGNTPDGLGYL